MAGNIELMHGYSTHQQMLVKYLMMAPEGSTVLELGTGLYSTPIIHEIAKARGLVFKVYYSDEAWMLAVKAKLPDVSFHKVPNWPSWQLTEPAFLVMLDSEELCINRYKQIDKMLPMAQYILCHDADTYIKRGVPLQPKYKGEYYDKHVPHTMVIDCVASRGVQGVAVPQLPATAHVCTTEAPVEVQAIGKVAVVCAFVPGGDYDSHYREYVQRLSDGLNLTPNRPDFFCVTYMNLEGVTGVKTIQPVNNFKGWHIKAEVFNPELWVGYDRVLYVDLDTVIRGDLTDLLANPAHFGMLRDFNKPNIMETGVVWFDPTLTGGLYNSFVGLNPQVRKKDADIVNAWLKTQGIAKSVCPLQDHYRIGSYKLHLMKAGKSPELFDIVCFHGQPRPHQVNWSLEQPESTVKTPEGKLVRKAQPVVPVWKDQDVFIIGGGPSVNDLDLSVLNDRNVIGVNDAFMLPCAKVCYFGDTAWEGHHREALANWGKPIYTTSGVFNLLYQHLDVIPSGLSKEPTVLGWNKNSGFAAINLACHLGAKRIYLVGFDMAFRDGQSNYHPNIRKVNSDTYKVFLRSQQKVADGLKEQFPWVQVFNLESAAGVSKMTVFPKLLFGTVAR